MFSCNGNEIIIAGTQILLYNIVDWRCVWSTQYVYRAAYRIKCTLPHSWTRWLHARFLRRGLRVLSPPDASRPVTKLRIGTASAGDAYSQARKTNPPAASMVPWYGVAYGYRKEDKHLMPLQKLGETCPCILLYLSGILINCF